MAGRSRRLTFVVLGLCGFLIVIATLFTLSRRYSNTKPENIAEIFPYGALRIGVDASNPPFAVATADDLFGLEIDMSKALADEIGIEAQFVNMTFDGIYDSLKADQVDMVIATLSIDPLRTAEVRYMRPYFNAGLVLISAAENPISLMSDMAGHRLAYEFGSNADSEARRWLRRILPFQTLPYELPEYALDAVRLGEADVALVDATSARLYLRDHDWAARVEYATVNPYVIAVREDRAEVWRIVDRALQTLEENGTLQTIIDKWL